MAKSNKRSKAKDDRPARNRYWSNHSLEENKVRRIMHATGMSEPDARRFWLKARGNRRTPWHRAAAAAA